MFLVRNYFSKYQTKFRKCQKSWHKIISSIYAFFVMSSFRLIEKAPLPAAIIFVGSSA
jgi:hypothetical protein